MKKGDKFVLLALLFVAFMILATMGYRFLSEQYMPPEITSQVEHADTSNYTDNTVDTDLPDASANNSSDSSADHSAESTTYQAPDFTALDMNGNEVKLSDYFGRPIIINFWATWCGPCKSELPAFDNMYARYGNEVEFMMLNLTDGSRETIDRVKSFVSNEEFSFPVYFDTTLEAASTYGAYSIPMTLFIDAKGIPVHSQMGAMSEETLEQLVQALIKYSNEATE